MALRKLCQTEQNRQSQIIFRQRIAQNIKKKLSRSTFSMRGEGDLSNDLIDIQIEENVTASERASQ
jgi:hypothetical protein